MKAFAVNFLVAVVTTGLLVPIAHAEDCGSDGDGSSSYKCESLNRDVSIDGLNNSDGSNSAILIVKSHKNGVYQGSESLNLAPKTDAIFDFSKSSFRLYSYIDAYQHVSLQAQPASAVITCPADSASFTGVLRYRLIGESEVSVKVSCRFSYSH